MRIDLDTDLDVYGHQMTASDRKINIPGLIMGINKTN